MAEYTRRRGALADQDMPDQVMRYALGQSIPFAEFMQNVYGSRMADIPGDADASKYRETQGMSPEQFVRSPYSQWAMQPDGTVKYRAGGEGFQQPTWIDQGGAGSGGIGYALGRVAPYAAGFAGLGAALGGLSSLGIPGLFGDAAAPAIGEGISPTLAQAAGGVTDFNMAAAANAGDLAALGESVNYLPGVVDQVPANLGQMGAGGSFPGGFKMPFPTQAPSWPGGGDPPVPGTIDDPVWKDIPYGGVAASGLGALMNRAAGIQDPRSPAQQQADMMGMVGNLLSTGLGAYASNQQANALQNIADQARNDRAPFLNSAIDMLNNPGAFYQRPEVMGAVDASLRGLSAKVGNPINNPGAIAQQAAYNTGLYNNTLNSRAALGLGNQDVISKLQTNAAVANTGPLRQIGSGLGSLFGQNYGDVLGGLRS